MLGGWAYHGGMQQGSKKVDLFHYLDYRKYLKDWYNETKKSRTGFSFRVFSKRAGFQSPNFFKLVMDGDRNLTEESLSKFMIGLKLNKQEQEFFHNLVFYNQAKTQGKKQMYYQNLLRSRKFNQIKPIDKDQYEYCSHWYHSVIRELIGHPDFDGTPEWLAAHIYPAITSSQAKKSLEVLEKLGFIKKDSKGILKQTSSLVSTGAEVTSLALFNYHMSMVDLTKEVLENVPAPRRDISSMTLGIVKERLPQLKEKIQRFRKEIMELVSTDEHPNEVVQMNIQMFPLTKEGEKKN